MNTVEKFLTETNLNWRVNSEPIQTESGLIINGYNALIREDTNDVLSVRTDSYFPYQNQRNPYIDYHQQIHNYSSSFQQYQ